MNNKINNALLVMLFILIAGMVAYKYYLDRPPENVLSLAEEELDQALAGEMGVWLLFGSATCDPCRDMHKLFEALRPEYEGRIAFIRVDVNDRQNKGMVEKYNIRYIPTTYILDGTGEIVFTEIGVITEEDLKIELNKVID
ncbi:MAG: thioredoxin family protein [Syntrophomonadaceae bacterium]|nr:thioredoxin family protein [Syntrophomonadaceae bacterium]